MNLFRSGRKLMDRGFCVLLLAGSVPLPALADAPANLKHEVLTTWTTDQGLPQNFVTAIQQTPDGFMWVGTNSGLTRFDGVHFRTFLHDGPTALRQRINTLVVDAAGTLWIGTTTGLFTYRSGYFHPVALGSSPSNILEIVCSQSDHSVWVRTADSIFHSHGLSATQNGLMKMQLPIDFSKVSSFTMDKPGNLWFSVGDTVVECNWKQILNSFPLHEASLLYTAPDGQVYAGDGHHLFRMGPQGFEIQKIPGPDEFVDLLIDRHGWLWMASGGLEGISRLADGKLETLDVRSGLQSNDARVLFEDRDGDIWIGTISGLQRLHHGVFTSYMQQDGLPEGHIQYDAIFQDRNGSLWTGTLDQGIFQFDGFHWHGFSVEQGIQRGQVRGFADGDNGLVVAISDYGLFTSAVKANTGKLYSKIPDIPAGYITSPSRASDGSLWFADLHKSVYRLKDGKLVHYGPAQGLTDDAVWAIVAEPGGSVWAGGRSGLFRFDGDRWKLEYASTTTVVAIVISHDGTQFLGTPSGLIHRIGTKAWTLTEEDGLPGDAVLAISEDQRGDLWVAASRGICRITHEQIVEVDKGQHRINPELFTEDDGLKSRSVLPIGQVTSLRARDGKIWFATATGPVVSDVSPHPLPIPQAIVDGIELDGDHLPAQSVTVKPGRHRLVFDFTAPAFVAPEQVHFRYRLLGWNREWMNAGEVRQASYEGLPPARYEFQVQAEGRTGQPGPISLGIRVDLEPHFWQTSIFPILVIAVLLALVAEVTRRRTLRQAEALNLRFQERAAERERIASHIHDTFIQDLTGTALQIELAGMQLGEDPAVALLSLTTLSARMREMIARSRDIVSNLHSMAGTQYTLLELLGHVEVEFRLSDTPVFVLQSEGKPAALHPFLRDEIYSICREAVANAFRHAAAHRIEVNVSFLPSKVIVEVKDDGVGMDEEIQTHGKIGHFGLSGMKTHARRINAVLMIQSIPGAGTRVLVETPIRFTKHAWRKVIAQRDRDS